MRLRAFQVTVKPCPSSQATTLFKSFWLSPNWSANCSGVSQWWKLGEKGFCKSSKSAVNSDRRLAVNANIREMFSSRSEPSARPRSFSGRNIGRTLPCSATREALSIACPMRSCPGSWAEAKGMSEKASPQIPTHFSRKIAIGCIPVRSRSTTSVRFRRTWPFLLLLR